MTLPVNYEQNSLFMNASVALYAEDWSIRWRS